MGDIERDQNGGAQPADQAPESDSALQEELRREASEGKGGVGDVSSNRNLTGSSTWETLPDSPSADGSSR